ncbi:hypothetical protein HELRODRAFT_190172 [Helobdella robusta]|uniref:Calponin-homology (CH) domain-containing protein n=1 Tax=Helobdella robusta TaxID=6412 RepID=T1FRR4_HELRO|nr:hypothetical protein HELRODRAFT_190172 [Helobdella robusta]ESO10779.1 hypothetical protein HELRODRAFT_190172 [Helobdella robusta]
MEQQRYDDCTTCKSSLSYTIMNEDVCDSQADFSTLNNEVTTTMQLAAFGKPPVVDFGQVLVGSCHYKKLIIENTFDTPVEVVVEKVPRKKNFQVEPLCFSIKEFEKFELIILWTPLTNEGVRELVILQVNESIRLQFVLLGVAIQGSVKSSKKSKFPNMRNKLMKKTIESSSCGNIFHNLSDDKENKNLENIDSQSARKSRIDKFKEELFCLKNEGNNDNLVSKFDKKFQSRSQYTMGYFRKGDGCSTNECSIDGCCNNEIPTSKSTAENVGKSLVTIFSKFIERSKKNFDNLLLVKRLEISYWDIANKSTPSIDSKMQSDNVERCVALKTDNNINIDRSRAVTHETSDCNDVKSPSSYSPVTTAKSISPMIGGGRRRGNEGSSERVKPATSPPIRYGNFKLVSNPKVTTNLTNVRYGTYTKLNEGEVYNYDDEENNDDDECSEQQINSVDGENYDDDSLVNQFDAYQFTHKTIEDNEDNVGWKRTINQIRDKFKKTIVDENSFLEDISTNIVKEAGKMYPNYQPINRNIYKDSLPTAKKDKNYPYLTTPKCGMTSKNNQSATVGSKLYRILNGRDESKENKNVNLLESNVVSDVVPIYNNLSMKKNKRRSRSDGKMRSPTKFLTGSAALEMYSASPKRSNGMTRNKYDAALMKLSPLRPQNKLYSNFNISNIGELGNSFESLKKRGNDVDDNRGKSHDDRNETNNDTSKMLGSQHICESFVEGGRSQLEKYAGFSGDSQPLTLTTAVARGNQFIGNVLTSVRSRQKPCLTVMQINNEQLNNDGILLTSTTTNSTLTAVNDPLTTHEFGFDAKKCNTCSVVVDEELEMSEKLEGQIDLAVGANISRHIQQLLNLQQKEQQLQSYINNKYCQQFGESLHSTGVDLNVLDRYLRLALSPNNPQRAAVYNRKTNDTVVDSSVYNFDTAIDNFTKKNETPVICDENKVTTPRMDSITCSDMTYSFHGSKLRAKLKRLTEEEISKDASVSAGSTMNNVSQLESMSNSTSQKQNGLDQKLSRSQTKQLKNNDKFVSPESCSTSTSTAERVSKVNSATVTKNKNGPTKNNRLLVVESCKSSSSKKCQRFSDVTSDRGSKMEGCGSVVYHSPAHLKSRKKLSLNQNQIEEATMKTNGSPDKRKLMANKAMTTLKLKKPSNKEAQPTPKVLMPNASKNMYYDERWMEKQERGFTVWMNYILAPFEFDFKAADFGSVSFDKMMLSSSSVATCGGNNVPASVKHFLANSTASTRSPNRLSKGQGQTTTKSSNSAATSKESLSNKIYSTERKFNKLRFGACRLYQSEAVVKVIERVEREVENGRLAIRSDRLVHIDFGLKKEILQMIFSYNLLWLKLGLETIYGEILPVSSSSSSCESVITKFLLNRFFINCNIANKFALPGFRNLYSNDYQVEIFKFLLKKFLILVYFLDVAKSQKLIAYNPCLFRFNAPFKTSRDILLAFSRLCLRGEGDVTRHLYYIGYVVTSEQSHLDEFDYHVINLATDLRDGLRLARLVEVLTQNWSLSKDLWVPVITRQQKLHNVDVVLTELVNKRVDLSIGRSQNVITAKDIVNGHRQKTLQLLWRIIFSLHINVSINQAVLKNEVNKISYELPKLLKAKVQSKCFSVLECVRNDRDSLEPDLYRNEPTLSLLFKWCQVICLLYGMKVENFTTSFSDGRAFCYLIHHYFPHILPLSLIRARTTLAMKGSINCMNINSSMDSESSAADWANKFDSNLKLFEKNTEELQQALENEKENCRLFQEKALEIGGLPVMLKSSDFFNTLPDEKLVIIYVSFLCCRLLETRTETRAARIIQCAWRRYYGKVLARNRKRSLTSNYASVTALELSAMDYVKPESNDCKIEGTKESSAKHDSFSSSVMSPSYSNLVVSKHYYRQHQKREDEKYKNVIDINTCVNVSPDFVDISSKSEKDLTVFESTCSVFNQQMSEKVDVAIKSIEDKPCSTPNTNIEAASNSNPTLFESMCSVFNQKYFLPEIVNVRHDAKHCCQNNYAKVRHVKHHTKHCQHKDEESPNEPDMNNASLRSGKEEEMMFESTTSFLDQQSSSSSKKVCFDKMIGTDDVNSDHLSKNDADVSTIATKLSSLSSKNFFISEPVMIRSLDVSHGSKAVESNSLSQSSQRKNCSRKIFGKDKEHKSSSSFQDQDDEPIKLINIWRVTSPVMKQASRSCDRNVPKLFGDQLNCMSECNVSGNMQQSCEEVNEMKNRDLTAYRCMQIQNESQNMRDAMANYDTHSTVTSIDFGEQSSTTNRSDVLSTTTTDTKLDTMMKEPISINSDANTSQWSNPNDTLVSSASSNLVIKKPPKPSNKDAERSSEIYSPSETTKVQLSQSKCIVPEVVTVGRKAVEDRIKQTTVISKKLDYDNEVERFLGMGMTFDGNFKLLTPSKIRLYKSPLHTDSHNEQNAVTNEAFFEETKDDDNVVSLYETAEESVNDSFLDSNIAEGTMGFERTINFEEHVSDDKSIQTFNNIHLLRFNKGQMMRDEAKKLIPDNGDGKSEDKITLMFKRCKKDHPLRIVKTNSNVLQSEDDNVNFFVADGIQRPSVEDNHASNQFATSASEQNLITKDSPVSGDKKLVPLESSFCEKQSSSLISDVNRETSQDTSDNVQSIKAADEHKMVEDEVSDLSSNNVVQNSGDDDTLRDKGDGEEAVYELTEVTSSEESSIVEVNSVNVEERYDLVECQNVYPVTKYVDVYEDDTEVEYGVAIHHVIYGIGEEKYCLSGDDLDNSFETVTKSQVEARFDDVKTSKDFKNDPLSDSLAVEMEMGDKKADTKEADATIVNAAGGNWKVSDVVATGVNAFTCECPSMISAANAANFVDSTSFVDDHYAGGREVMEDVTALSSALSSSVASDDKSYGTEPTVLEVIVKRDSKRLSNDFISCSECKLETTVQTEMSTSIAQATVVDVPVNEEVITTVDINPYYGIDNLDGNHPFNRLEFCAQLARKDVEVADVNEELNAQVEPSSPLQINSYKFVTACKEQEISNDKSLTLVPLTFHSLNNLSFSSYNSTPELSSSSSHSHLHIISQISNCIKTSEAPRQFKFFGKTFLESENKGEKSVLDLKILKLNLNKFYNSMQEWWKYRMISRTVSKKDARLKIHATAAYLTAKRRYLGLINHTAMRALKCKEDCNDNNDNNTKIGDVMMCDFVNFLPFNYRRRLNRSYLNLDSDRDVDNSNSNNNCSRHAQLQRKRKLKRLHNYKFTVNKIFMKNFQKRKLSERKFSDYFLLMGSRSTLEKEIAMKHRNKCMVAENDDQLEFNKAEDVLSLEDDAMIDEQYPAGTHISSNTCVPEDANHSKDLIYQDTAAAMQSACEEEYECQGEEEKGNSPISRTKSALNHLLKCKKLSHVLAALMYINDKTRESMEFCECMVECNTVWIMVQIIRSCNRSVPHIELIKNSVNILLNFAKHSTTSKHLSENEQLIETTVELMQTYQNKNKDIFISACLLLASMASRNEQYRNMIVRRAKVVDKLQSIHASILRKHQIEKRQQKAKQLTKPTPSTPSSKRAVAAKVLPDWLQQQQQFHIFEDGLQAVVFLLKQLNVKI